MTENLEKKAWYRFFKLLYVFAYVLAVSVVLLIGYSELPTEYIDSHNSVIRCANGKEYSAGASSIYATGSGQLDASDDVKATKLCEDIFDRAAVDFHPPMAGKEVPLEDIPEELRYKAGAEVPLGFVADISVKNYTFIPLKAVRGSYATLFWSLGTVILVGEVIRRSFLYVVAGRPFFNFPRWKS